MAEGREGSRHPTKCTADTGPELEAEGSPGLTLCDRFWRNEQADTQDESGYGAIEQTQPAQDQRALNGRSTTGGSSSDRQRHEHHYARCQSPSRLSSPRVLGASGPAGAQ